MPSAPLPAAFYRTLVEWFTEGRRFALALVLETEGSTPVAAGAKALLEETGCVCGTIGGGWVEAEAQRRAADLIEALASGVWEWDLSHGDCAGREPICGGRMRVLVDGTAVKDSFVYLQVAEAAAQRKRGVLRTAFQGGDEPAVAVRWHPAAGLPADADYPGGEALRQCLTREQPSWHPLSGASAAAGSGVFLDPILPPPRLLIAGGGHLGQALAWQASLVGFEIVVVDDRPEFADPARFPPLTVTHCGEVAAELGRLASDHDTYVAIVTRGHQHDAEALAATLPRPVAYLGMVGSRRKVALLRESFLATGRATLEELDRVHAPIGLDIGAETASEIAASIVAELIAVRRRGGKAGARAPAVA